MSIAPLATPLTGCCTCSRVRYRILEDPIAFYACHCTDCRRESGAAYGLSMVFRRGALEPAGGEVRTIRVELADGRTRCATVCTHCLVRVWSDSRNYAQIVNLSAGTLDDANAYEPFGNMWLASACAWATPVPGPRFDRQPEDPIAMVRAWQEHRRKT
jgi:hypothetical protein